MSAPLPGLPLQHPTLRRGVRLEPGDDVPQCTAVTFDSDGVDRCSSRAEPAHDWHSASGARLELDEDGLPELVAYGVAWRTLPALPAGITPEEDRT